MYQDVREEPHPLGDLVLGEDGEIVGRERAVERVASSIKALQDRGALKKQPSATTPPRTAPEGLLPRTVLPPSLSSQRFAALRGHSTRTHSASAQPVQWMAVVAAACFAIATTGVSPSRAAETVAAPPPQQQQQLGIMGATQQLSDELVASTPASSAAASMSVKQVEERLKSIPVTAIVNTEGQPYMIDKERDQNLGFFYIEPSDALRDLQVLKQGGQPTASLKIVPLSEVYFPFVTSSDTPKADLAQKDELGGLLRLRPSTRQVVLANRAINANGGGGNGFLPTALDARSGQVPVFYSERVVLQDEGGGSSFPFFFSKEDLDDAWRGGDAAPTKGGAADAGFSEQAFGGGMSPGQKRRKAAEGEKGIPIGLLRVATLDGLVKQMLSGDVDLRKAVLIGSREAEVAIEGLRVTK